MKKLIDIIGLFFTITVVFFIHDYLPRDIVYIIIAIVICCCLNIDNNSKFLISTEWLFIAVVCFLFIPLVYYLPVYNYLLSKQADKKLILINNLLAIVILGISIQSLSDFILVCCFNGLAQILCYRTKEASYLADQLLVVKDDSWEQNHSLMEQNTFLINQQETQLELQLAKERNRIARDIHDNVGHLLSRAILQLGAIYSINQSTSLKEPLDELQVTVNSAMDSIRRSVHNLHDDSLSFVQAVEGLIAKFSYCPIELSGIIWDNLSIKEEKIMLMTIKEALNNVIKHSHATLVNVDFSELPGFYRCQIRDNGTGAKSDVLYNGIGLSTMKSRIKEVNGQVHINTVEGFSIVIIIPKGEV